LSWLVFPSFFLLVKPHIPSWTLLCVQPWAHSYTHTDVNTWSDFLTNLPKQGGGIVTPQYALKTYFMSLRPFNTRLTWHSCAVHKVHSVAVTPCT
jgi:hypothetical protein